MLRERLLYERRTRLGRRGVLGPVVKALHALAALLDADLRKSARRGQCTTTFQLIMRACYGPLLTERLDGSGYNVAPLRTHRKERLEARELTAAVVAALGGESGTTAGEVRSVADRLATQLFPHL
ncbi:hypothetical protein [Streptomyces flaveolus]|uniref:hypothetical protein n=1 Tax=Streptomyces flaveolus TaxID=67297 RepID=UPI003325B680